MVTTRSRSQGSPQIRDLEEVENSRKRTRSEQSSPIQVKKRSQRNAGSGNATISSAHVSHSAEFEEVNNGTSPTSPDTRSKDTGDSSDVHLALRQRNTLSKTSAPNEPTSAPVVQGTRSKHVRFGSEDNTGLNNAVEPDQPPPSDPAVVQAATASESDANVSDDEEAPEAISTATSQAQARNLADGAAKAVRSKQKAEKDLRKRRDARLKQQAQGSSAKRIRNTTNATSSEETPNDASKLAHKLLQSGRMPEFLPSEILEVEPDLLPLNIPQVKAPSASLSRRRHRLKSGHSVEVVRQGRVVKILESSLSAHPPPATALSRRLRESWLEGRRKNDSSVAAMRRPFAKKFVTR